MMIGLGIFNSLSNLQPFLLEAWLDPSAPHLPYPSLPLACPIPHEELLRKSNDFNEFNIRSRGIAIE